MKKMIGMRVDVYVHKGTDESMLALTVERPNLPREGIGIRGTFSGEEDSAFNLYLTDEQAAELASRLAYILDPSETSQRHDTTK